MPTSNELTLASPSAKHTLSEKDYIELEKELVQFKEKTYENLQQYNKMFDFLEEETEKKQDLLQQLTSAQETISLLEQKIIDLEKNDKEMRALRKSKLGRLTVKYWAFRKRLALRLRKRVFKRG